LGEPGTWDEETAAEDFAGAEERESPLFDVETPSFQRVLDAPPVARPPRPRRRWLPVIVFAVIVTACVALGVVILHQVGILGLGVDLSPMPPLGALGVASP
jgi:hypothetical protein